MLAQDMGSVNLYAANYRRNLIIELNGEVHRPNGISF